MEKPQSLPTIARVTFIVHFIVAVLIGLAFLLIPATYLKWFGYPAIPVDLQPPIRAFGAMILGFGGLTSLYGVLAKNWERVDYIVRGEALYLALQTLVFAISAIMGKGPALGNWLFAVLSVVLFALFAATFVNRSK